MKSDHLKELPAEDPLNVLVIDDNKSTLTLITKILKIEGLTPIAVESGEEALRTVNEKPVDVILLDVMMPKMDGFEVCSRIKDNESTRLIPIIIVTALNEREDKLKGIEAGCDDFISKPIDKVELVTRIRALGKTKRLNDDLEKAESVLMSLARAVEAKDDTTGTHCDRLISLSEDFGKFLNLSNADIKVLKRVSVLHDVGKIGMPDTILLKPDKLTDKEWDVMRKHPLIGEEICKPLRSLRAACPIIRSHHERWNGTGYPDRLKKEGIPYLARVFQILDAYDALTTERPYKRAFSKDEALKLLQEETEKGLWDPEIMKKFIEFIS